MKMGMQVEYLLKANDISIIPANKIPKFTSLHMTGIHIYVNYEEYIQTAQRHDPKLSRLDSKSLIMPVLSLMLLE